MPWNEPGGNNNNNDPWSGRGKQSPPDLDKIISEFVKKTRAFFKFDTQGTSQWKPATKVYGIGFSAILLVIFLIWLLAGLFIVNPAEEAVILRFGQFSEILQPGLHWIARFIDTKYLVDIQKISSFSLQGDFLTKSSDQDDPINQSTQIVLPKNISEKTAGISDQSKNLVNVELNVQYRITDPRAYLFSGVGPDNTIQQVAAGALSDVVGKMKLDEVLTTGRELLSSNVLQRTKQILTSYNIGLEVVAVTLRKIQAPDQVKAAFNDVNRADQDKATLIQQAQAYASKVVPLAQGVAARILADANGYQQQVVLTAEANTANYKAVLTAYQGSPNVTRERLYLESIQKILESTTKVLVDANSSNNLLYLPLDKIMRKNLQESLAANKQNIVSLPAPQTNTSTNESDNSDQTVSAGIKNETN